MHKERTERERKKKFFATIFFCIYFFEQNFTSEEQECMYANTRVTETSIKRIQSFIICFLRRILIESAAGYFFKGPQLNCNTVKLGYYEQNKLFGWFRSFS